MKLMKFFLAVSILAFMTSCAKDEATIAKQEFTNTETTIYKLDLPEGVTVENAAEWFNQLPEDQIADYLAAVENSNEAVERACGTWSSWSGWLTIRSTFSCLSRRCPNPQSQLNVLKRRSRVRQCTDGPEVETQTYSNISCYPPC